MTPKVWNAGFAHAEKAVVFADIVESVRLIDRNEDGVIAHWLQIEDRARREILPPHGGRFVKNLGDGMLIEFATPKNAVAAALEIHGLCRSANLFVPQETRISLRIGVVKGAVIIEDSDIYGRDVNLAARLATLAGPGETVVSVPVRDEILDSVDGEILDLGECYLRHLPRPVRAYRVGPPGLKSAPAPATAAARMRPAIAVLPFELRMTPTEHALVGDILAEEVIGRLSPVNELSVISRLSTTALRARSLSVAEISGLLGVDYVLSGAFRVVDGTITIDVELADGESERILWMDRLTAPLDRLLATDVAVADRIAASATTAISLHALVAQRSNPIPTLEGYKLLMSAIALMHRLAPRDFDEAHGLLEALVDRGDRHPTPHAWLANWHVLKVFQGWSEDLDRDVYLARDHSSRALDADPESSQALTIDGYVNTHLLKRFDVAEARYDAALACNPSNALALLFKGTMHAFRDEGAQAVEFSERAMRVSPLDPHRFFYETHLAGAYLTAGDHEKAREIAERSLRANRRHSSTLRILTVALWELDRKREAREMAKELLVLEPGLTVSGYLQRTPSAAFKIGQRVAEVMRSAGVPK